MFSFTEKKNNIFNYLPWFFLKQEKWKKIYLDSWKEYKKIFIIKIKNITDRSMAQKLINSNIFINKHQLPVLKKNNYYWKDIIHFQVFNTKNIYLGKVINLTRTIYNDILIIQKNKEIYHKKQILIPFIHNKIIKKVDQTKKVITVQWD